MALDAARNEVAKTRRRIAEEVEKGGPAADYVVLAPLLERFEASAVAAALYRLWQAVPQVEQPAAAPPARAQRLWVGTGKRDGTTPNDLVAVLTREAGVPRQAIGKIEVRESFAIVELGEGQDLGDISDKVTGKSIRKRRLVARPDKGPKRRERD
jgi:ATP-dependent RNA helicase DeaD